MNNNNLATDVYIKTEHLKKKSKSKVSFSVIINKVLVSAVILTTIAGAATPAEAATDISNQYSDAVKKYNAAANITQNYEVSVESAIYNAKLSIETIEMMKVKGTVTQEALSKLATEITNLERAVNLEGKEASKEVVDTILKAESVVSDVKGAEKVQAAIAVAKQSLSISNAESIKIDNAKAVQLTDISTHWGKTYIEKLVGMGGISGYPDGTFKPDNKIKRAEFLKIALLVADNSINADASIDHWASGYLNAAYELDIVRETEIPQTKEALDKNITRYEMARIMVRINENMQKENVVGIDGIKNIMTDYSSLPQTYRAYVEQAYMKGLIGGFPDGSFGGDKTGTRAEATTMLVRMVDQTSRVKVDVSKPVQSGAIVNEKGQMTVEKSKEYALKAFDTAKFYSENGKYYLSVDLGTLPDGFKWQPGADVVDAEGKYLYYTSDRRTTGLTGKQVFELTDVTQSDIQKGATASFSLKVITDKNVTSTGFYKLDTEMKGKAYENNSETAKSQWFNYDTTNQFAGWK